MTHPLTATDRQIRAQECAADLLENFGDRVPVHYLALLRACDVLPPATFENQLVEELFALHGAIVGTRI